jgi:hypothetical protein
MKATIDVPDALYRRVKARAAMEGRAIRDVTIELYEHWLVDREVAVGSDAVPAPALAPALAPGRAPLTGAEWLARWKALGEETDRLAVDPRSSVEILLADRR